MMKRLHSILWAAIGLAAPVASAAQAGDVTIAIHGVRAADGPLYVSLQTREEFLQPRGAHGEIVQSPQQGTVWVTLPDVPKGEYSVSVWHDIDGDRQFDRKASGEPLDGWAMLNGADRGRAPTFEESKFAVSAGGASISVNMVYAEE